MKTTTLLSFCFIVTAAVAHAGSRSSASYSIVADTADGGGRRSASASYTNDGSVGGIVGTSSAADATETAKHGYVGQLYDVTGLTLTSDSTNVNEGASKQLAAWLVLDDATFVAAPAASVTWSGTTPPLVSVIGGLATAGIVYQDTAATVQGICLGQTGSLALTVKNVSLDNFGSYAGDGLDDAWQNQYFGLNNPLAAPLLDPDGDGQANAFEFTAGLVPTDPASRFVLTIADVPGQLTWKKLIFSPRLVGRIYTVKAKPSLLTGSYLPLTNFSGPTDTGPNGEVRTIVDQGAGSATKFYRVEITKP